MTLETLYSCSNQVKAYMSIHSRVIHWLRSNKSYNILIGNLLFVNKVINIDIIDEIR